MAHLRLWRPEDAAGEFSAVLAHRGQSPLSPILVMSQLGLASAYALQRNALVASLAHLPFPEGAERALSILPNQ